ncbi:hypothetical protein O166_16220 [Pseudogulbenkiania ferrooxidans EGD-HP2]|uniref:Uncharacterized protein n=1 Tax=Pseudogulbenkiania ferrooxidans EGD-HP2 TaxID=1388764 RepID=A0ABN0N287_9NEIS|nr:hypothetical protein O166_16220 [Pseudogulbenkiania ferrooxidans EGD-HP2]
MRRQKVAILFGVPDIHGLAGGTKMEVHDALTSFILMYAKRGLVVVADEDGELGSAARIPYFLKKWGQANGYLACQFQIKFFAGVKNDAEFLAAKNAIRPLFQCFRIVGSTFEEILHLFEIQLPAFNVNPIPELGGF